VSGDLFNERTDVLPELLQAHRLTIQEYLLYRIVVGREFRKAVLVPQLLHDREEIRRRGQQLS